MPEASPTYLLHFNYLTNVQVLWNFIFR
jgi:hypothetical protein